MKIGKQMLLYRSIWSFKKFIHFMRETWKTVYDFGIIW